MRAYDTIYCSLILTGDRSFIYPYSVALFSQIHATSDTINVEKYPTCGSFFAGVSTIGAGRPIRIRSAVGNATPAIIANTSPDAVAGQSIRRLLVSQFICSANRLVHPHSSQGWTVTIFLFFPVISSFAKTKREEREKENRISSSKWTVNMSGEHFARVNVFSFLFSRFVYSWRDAYVWLRWKRLNAWMAAMRQK